MIFYVLSITNLELARTKNQLSLETSQYDHEDPAKISRIGAADNSAIALRCIWRRWGATAAAVSLLVDRR